MNYEVDIKTGTILIKGNNISIVLHTNATTDNISTMTFEMISVLLAVSKRIGDKQLKEYKQNLLDIINKF